MILKAKTTKRPRDSQRSKVYAAENKATVMHMRSKPLSTLKDVDKFAQRVITGRVAKKWGAARPVRVNDGRGSQCARANAFAIDIPVMARRQWIILHELAHTINRRATDGRKQAGHGWRFCAIYLELVRAYLGKEAEADLKAQFKAVGVKYKAPRPKRAMTVGEKEALKARLAAGRAKKQKAEIEAIAAELAA